MPNVVVADPTVPRDGRHRGPAASIRHQDIRDERAVKKERSGVAVSNWEPRRTSDFLVHRDVGPFWTATPPVAEN